MTTPSHLALTRRRHNQLDHEPARQNSQVLGPIAVPGLYYRVRGRTVRLADPRHTKATSQPARPRAHYTPPGTSAPLNYPGYPDSCPGRGQPISPTPPPPQAFPPVRRTGERASRPTAPPGRPPPSSASRRRWGRPRRRDQPGLRPLHRDILDGVWGVSHRLHLPQGDALKRPRGLDSLRPRPGPRGRRPRHPLRPHLLVGVFQIGFGLVRAGSLTRFISHSVLTGFVTGAALLIVLGQLGTSPATLRGGDPDPRRARPPLHAGDIRPDALAIGLLTIVLVIVLRRAPHLASVALLLPLIVTALSPGSSFRMSRSSAVSPPFLAGLPAFAIPTSPSPPASRPGARACHHRLVMAVGVTEAIPERDGPSPT